MFKTRRQWTSSIGHEEGMEWRTKTFRTRGVVSERKMKMMIFHGTSLPQGPKVKKEEMFCADDEKDSFPWYITPTGSKAEERKKRCSALTIDGSRGSKGGGGCRGDSEDSDEVYSDRRDSDDSNSDKGGYSLMQTMVHHVLCRMDTDDFLCIVLMSGSMSPITCVEFLFNAFHVP